MLSALLPRTLKIMQSFFLVYLLPTIYNCNLYWTGISGFVQTPLKSHAVPYIFPFSCHTRSQLGIFRKTSKVGHFRVDWLYLKYFNLEWTYVQCYFLETGGLQARHVLLVHFCVHSDYNCTVTTYSSF